MKNNISEYNRVELIQFFRNNYNAIEQQFNILLAIENCSTQYNSAKDNEKSSKHGLIICMVTCIIVYIIAAIMVYSLEQGVKDIVFWILSVSCLMLFLILISAFLGCMVSSKKKIKIATEEMNKTRNDLIVFLNNHTELRMIPMKYQTPIAIKMMMEYLINYRANNWTEAVNLLEDTIYKNQMLYQQSQQSAMLNQQIEQLRRIQSSINLPSFGILIG
ncbi:MAG: hypothetical protein ACI4GW_01555 [Lachnospiraceae bacterium]